MHVEAKFFYKMKLQERFIWALAVLGVQADDEVLDIGGGTGILAEQVAQKLTSGKITLLDKSETMIRTASKRNEGFLQSGKMHCLISDMANPPLPQHSFDKIWAFNVSVLWKNPSQNLPVIHSLLKPEGKLYLFHQPPHEITRQLARQASEQCRQYGFSILDTLYRELTPASAFCLIAQPIP